MFGKFMRSAKKVTNANLMEAIVAGCVLVAAADGTVSRDELAKVEKLLNNNDNLAAFAGSEIKKTITRYQNVLEADFGVGQAKMLKEIREIADNPEQCEEVFLNMLAVAKADNSIDESEKAVLIRVASELGQNVADYGIT